jgi:outer membrane protein assembly factor BamB
MAAFGGYVFVVNKTDTIALDGGTGNIVYAIPNPGGFLGAPLYLGGNYMLIADDCYVVDTGTFVWAGPAGFSNLGFEGFGQILISGGGAPVTDPQHLPGTMFFNNGCGWLLSNPANPPTLLWNDTGKAGVATSSAALSLTSSTGSVYGDGVIVYGDSADQTFSGFNAATGAYLWTVPVPSTEFCGTTSIDGVFAFGTQDGYIYAWNITTGHFMWKWNPGNPDSDWSWSLGSSYGMIYGHNQDGHFYAVNATTGAPVWDAYTNNGVAYSGTFSIAGGYIYAQMGDNEYRNPYTGQYGHSEFDCFNAYNGTEVWSLPIENGAPDNAQCNAYGNLYLIPTTSSSTPGVYTYSTTSSVAGGIGTLGEVVCIGNGPAESWPQYMNDATHDSDGWGPTNLTVLWSKPLGSGAAFASSPVFAKGIGYIGSTDQNVYAFNASNGKVIWNFATKAPIYSTPAVVNGYVYTGADDGNVYCLDATTGGLVWSVALPAGPATNEGFGETGTDGPPSPMVVGNNLYVGDNNYLYCLSTSNGAINWKYTWGSALLIGTPTIVNNVVYIAPNQGGGSLESMSYTNPDGFLYELNAQTGALIGNITIPYVINPFIAAGNPSAIISGEGILAPVTVDSADNIAFVQQVNMRTFAVDLTTGKILWTYDAYYNPGTPGQWGVDNDEGVLYAAGNVYFNEWYSIVCLNARTGNVTWTTWLNREDMTPISIYAGKIYVDTYTYNVYVLNAATGAKLSYASCGNEPTEPVLYAGNLYVASGDFNITCYTQAAAVSVRPAPTPTPTPAPTQTPSPTSAPTATPLSLSPLGWSLLYVTIAIIITIIVAVAIVGALVLRTLKKRP